MKNRDLSIFLRFPPNKLSYKYLELETEYTTQPNLIHLRYTKKVDHLGHILGKKGFAG